MTTDQPALQPTRQSQRELLNKYVTAVIHAPASLGLTAAKEERVFWERHVLDALQLINTIPKNDLEKDLKVIDIGSGNGIPGIPTAIALPRWHVTLVESNNRKCGFLDMFCKFSKIDNITIALGRAETLAHLYDYRSKFDIAFARALGKLPTALELCAAFVNTEGHIIIPHGKTYLPELSMSQNAMKKLGVILEKAIPYAVGNYQFTSLFFKKYCETLECYPRKIGLPKKHPL